MSAGAKYVPGPIACISTSNHAHDYRLSKPGGLPLLVSAPANDHAEQRATAAQIAASYNACSGIPTDALLGLDVAEALRIGDAWKAQRDEVLAALRDLSGKYTFQEQDAYMVRAALAAAGAVS